MNEANCTALDAIETVLRPMFDRNARRLADSGADAPEPVAKIGVQVADNLNFMLTCVDHLREAHEDYAAGIDTDDDAAANANDFRKIKHSLGQLIEALSPEALDKAGVAAAAPLAAKSLERDGRALQPIWQAADRLHLAEIQAIFAPKAGAETPAEPASAPAQSRLSLVQ